MPLWLWLVSFAVVAWEGLVYRNGNRSVLMTVLFWAAVIGSVAIALIFGHRMTGLEQETQRRTKLPRYWAQQSPMRQHRVHARDAWGVRAMSNSLTPDADARICSFECTFCTPCTTELGSVCPNCGGELVSRPRRAAQ